MKNPKEQNHFGPRMLLFTSAIAKTEVALIKADHLADAVLAELPLDECPA